jgi:hypothetical protein
MTPEQRARCLELAEKLLAFEECDWNHVVQLRHEAAALLRECAGAGLRVKPLEWVDCQPDDIFGITSRAACVFPGNFNEYVIFDDAASSDGSIVDDGGLFWFEGGSCFPTLEAAKAAAQADYERRILAALEPAPGYIDGWNAALEAAAGEAAGEVAAHGAAHLAPFVRRAIRAITPPERPKQ